MSNLAYTTSTFNLLFFVLFTRRWKQIRIITTRGLITFVWWKVRQIPIQWEKFTTPAEERRLWRRYIYLWINYALYEELLAKVCSIFAAVGLRGCRSSLQKKLTRISSSSQSVFCYLRWIRAVLSISFHGKLVHLSSPYSPGLFLPLSPPWAFPWVFMAVH